MHRLKLGTVCSSVREFQTPLSIARRHDLGYLCFPRVSHDQLLLLHEKGASAKDRVPAALRAVQVPELLLIAEYLFCQFLESSPP